MGTPKDTISYGMKLWSNNIDLFDEAAKAHKAGLFDFIEILYNPLEPIDFTELNKLREIPVNVHACNNTIAFHEFVLGSDEILLWKSVIGLADFFDSKVIVLHAGRTHSFESFKRELAKIDDPRIHVENMGGMSTEEYPTFAISIEDIVKLRTLKPICFDLEKAVKSCCHFKIDYRTFITTVIQNVRPKYLHISGGDPENQFDEHTNLWDSVMDFAWMKNELLKIEGGCELVFETPKTGGIANDIKNMEFFRAL